MGLVTAATWTIAALAGAHLLRRWLAVGGGRRAKVTRFPLALVLSHPALAVSALACWAAALATGSRALAWLATAGLAAAALLGCVMFTRWLGEGRHGDAVSGVPVLAVLHGLAGVTAFALVFLTASAARVF
ncbi:hypothetical protein Nocox_29835 [Nonomuraea coxensis DSM 45129]|uniref:Uncharacterized protein n=1 Tax=Nonomuraea coxensis DSM 45129 TaxID=1122611 RepID=A0ABX8U717_9ACTN|nr:hypothetical protein [Nonomuraea coxensis]QYC43551.1 hypothetical protein Nocox_29835 [Nonomuraea coxensis DSM 45129]